MAHATSFLEIVNSTLSCLITENILAVTLKSSHAKSKKKNIVELRFSSYLQSWIENKVKVCFNIKISMHKASPDKTHTISLCEHLRKLRADKRVDIIVHSYGEIIFCR